MSEVAEAIQGEVIQGAKFFAPASSDMVDGLMGQYAVMRAKIEGVNEFIFGGDNAAAMSYFMNGNRDGERYVRQVNDMFKLDGAIAQLNADYWQKAMLLTDVYAYMPAARRNEWDEQIRERTTPEFTDQVVRDTMTGLLAARESFFGERVDGIFRSLSGEHVTNRPEGFSKRMILYISHKKDHITDLRQVVAKFMGRDDEPNWQSTDQLLAVANRNSGQWVNVDGSSMRIRTYLKGTAHFEVHPDMAWRLNCVLASLYPTAIPSEFRQKPKKKLKDFVMMDRPLPFLVLQILGDMRKVRTTPHQGYYAQTVVQPKTTNEYSVEFGYGQDKHAKAEAERVLEAIGGVKMSQGGSVWFEFDYNYREALDEIVASGCIPDQKSYQFYPTNEKLAQIAVELADIKPTDKCLEPSAGQGGIAQFMPKRQTLCVELSALHCQILEGKELTAINADFIEWQPGTRTFQKVVMNPPFSEGRWQAHTEKAASMIYSGGRLVAILPASAKNKFTLKGFDCNWSQVYDNEFAGTSTAVVILTADRKQ